MAKGDILPPPIDAQKRETTVNLRFSTDDYERLKRVAQFCHTNVSALLHYATINATLPQMEREMKRKQVEQVTSTVPVLTPLTKSLLEPPPKMAAES